MSKLQSDLGPQSGPFSIVQPNSLSGRARVGMAVAFAILIAVKMPDILLQGRFWAEEGKKFFENAWLLPWPRALLAPWGGYLNITANLAGMLAWHVPPLEFAPYASTLLALVFQLCPAIVLLTSRIAWLEPPVAMLAALLLVLTPPAIEEVWLSSIGSQCHLTLCAALILACGTRSDGGVAVFRLVLLALAALSGPGSWVLTPLFAFRAMLDRSWHRAVQACVLCTGVLLQLLFFYSHQAERVYSIRPVLFMDIAFVRHVLIPRKSVGLSAVRNKLSTVGLLPWWPAVIVGVILLGYGAVLVVGWRREPFWMALAAAALIGASYIGSLGPPSDMLLVGNGGRYTFAPQVLIGLSLLGCAATQTGAVRLVASLCVVWLLIVGALNYFRPSSWAFAHGPAWRVELAQHRRDPTHVVASWPPGWVVPLPPKPSP